MEENVEKGRNSLWLTELGCPESLYLDLLWHHFWFLGLLSYIRVISPLCKGSNLEMSDCGTYQPLYSQEIINLTTTPSLSFYFSG